MDQQKQFEVERRIGSLEKDFERMNSSIADLKNDFREEQTEIKEAIKDLAKSQNMLATSMTKIEAGITTLLKAVPIIFSIVGAFWAYNTFVIDRTTPVIQEPRK